MKIREKSTRGQSGFTLIEVMIATVILGVGLLAVADAFARGMLIMSRSPLHAIAQEQAEITIQNIRFMQDSGVAVPNENNVAITDELVLPNGKEIHLADHGFTRSVTLDATGQRGVVTISYRAPGLTGLTTQTFDF
jgi:prepilin-type N-terminal cleavage/methylation domain-containing protein